MKPVIITCGGRGERLGAFDLPKALYPIYRIDWGKDQFGKPSDTPLNRVLRQLNLDWEPVIARGYKSDLIRVQEPSGIITWTELNPWGVVKAIGYMSEVLHAESMWAIMGDTIWSQHDLDAFLINHDTPIVLYHDEHTDRYSETYGLYLNGEGQEILRLFLAQEFCNPLVPEVAFSWTDRVRTDRARIGHFERAIDFSGFASKKKRIVADRVMDFDDQRQYDQVNERLYMGWFD